ncbi:Protein cps3, partial [Colletotrichum chlorophyti]
TSHVPCKFFRQGACQAGNACPFSHDLGAASDNICKYFAKGNCKFGPKCANIHVLPDGRRINYGKNGVTIGTAPINLGGRINPTSATAYHPTSALTSGLYREGVTPYTSAYPYGDERQQQLGHPTSLDNGLPTIDTTYSHAGSAYGSPRDDETSRFGLGLSPINAKGLSVLDAPLPASFDSQGISNAARFPAGPWPSSVPSQFGLESPSPSLNNAKDSRTSETLKLLHTSAFGSSDFLAAPNAIASGSPPGQPISTEEYYGKRAMHSSRYAKPKLLSASMPKTTVDHDWEAEFAFLEEDCVPSNLQDLLTPAEKARRGSLRTVDGEPGSENGTKFGSPITGASPSRWGPLFQRQKEEELETSRSMHKHGPSAFGHVGSPLRNSVLSNEMGGASARPIGSRTGGDPLSALTQQLQRTRLGDDGSSSPHLHPLTAVGRAPSNGVIGKERERGIERHVSSGSISSSVTGRYTTPIDEEDPAFVFNMEEVDEQSSARLKKRGSAGFGIGGAWSYANAVSNKGAAAGSGLAKEQREPSVSIETVGGR